MFHGKVRKGKNRGKKLGFPTANIALHKKIPEGVYISKTKVKGFWHNSLTFIGNATTFGEKTYQAESYLLDFKNSIYDQWIAITLFKKIRKNKKFKSTKELVAQMKKDEKVAKEYFQETQRTKFPYVST